MSVSADDFKEIMTDGFQQRYEDTDEGESELRCFTCGKKAQLDEGLFSDNIVCEDDHEQELLDFLIMHINMRDGVTDRTLKMNCWFDGVVIDE